ncbi:MAG: AraC family transcriptional regulator [Anaerolineae bacterium]|nr:AraC family transcriptional regulator [Anaerolineae bacterium]
MTAKNTFWPESVLVGEVVYPPGGVFGPRVQPSIELVIVHEGEMTVWVDDERRYAPANTISILFPGHVERFAFAADRETRHSFMHITVPDLEESLNARLRRLPWLLPLSPRMSGWAHEALALRRSTLPTAPEMLKALAALMLWRFIGEGERALGSQSDDVPHPAFERARQFIQAHLHEPLTLEAIAAAAAVSPSHLIRLFQSALQTTPIAYLWECRVASGVEMLENTGLPVGMIAERCGFQTSYHFSRRVRQRTGLSPLEVRRRAWQRDV